MDKRYEVSPAAMDVMVSGFVCVGGERARSGDLRE